MTEKKLDKETTEKIQKLQLLEQNLQNLLLQKQTFQLELDETGSALSELKEAKEEAYKIIGSIMVKVKKDKLEKELLNKKETLSLRIKNIEKQEQIFKEQFTQIRTKILQKIQGTD